MSQPSSKVAVLGMGIIGSRVAARLAQHGFQVNSWNRSRHPLQSAESPGEAVANAGMVQVFLKDGPALREVFATIDLTGEQRPLVANHATVDPESLDWLAAWCAQHHCEFLDAPFTGSKVAAQQGELVYYLGGSPAAIERARPVLSASARLLMPIGPAGAATIIKIATNLVSACTVQALAEALAITTHHGIPGDQLLAALRENACRSPLAEMKLPAMLADTSEPHFSLANMLKDTRLALALAAALPATTPAIAAVATRMAELEQLGHGSADFSAVFRAYQPHAPTP